jgi:cytochrome c oxidase subunit 2
MRGEVVALSPEDFNRWVSGEVRPEGGPIAGPRYVPPQLGLAEKPPGQDVSLARQGERVAAEHGCLRCHTLDGTPHLGPTWAGLYGREVEIDGGGRVVADAAYLTESMMDPAVKIVRGYSNLMPSYLGKLGAGEVAALVELIKSLRDVQPSPESAGEITP